MRDRSTMPTVLTTRRKEHPLMLRSLTLVLVAASLLVACKTREINQSQKEFDRAAVQSYFDDQRIAGTLAEKTLWPHYFTPNSAELNDLGQRTLAPIIHFYLDNPGPLSIRRGSEGEELYAARVATVQKALIDGGIALERIQITDANAGGPGMPTVKVMQILDKPRGRQRSASSDSSQYRGTTLGVPR